MISDAEISAKLRLIKVDKSSGKKINKNGIKFKIKNLDTNEYICQEITYPNHQTICEYETDNNGEFITPLPLRPANYQIEEIDQKINDLESIDLKNEFIKLKDDHEKLSKTVKDNKDSFNSLFMKINTVTKNYLEGDENLRKKMDSWKKYIDDKILEVNTKLDLFLNNFEGEKDENGENTIQKKFDLSGLNDFMQKLIGLENRFEDFVAIAQINNVHDKLKILDDNKAEKNELEKQLKEINDELLKRIKDNKDNIDTINKGIKSVNEQIRNINIGREKMKSIGPVKQEGQEGKEHSEDNIDINVKLDSLDPQGLELYLSRFVLKSDYDDFLKVNKEKINKMMDEIKLVNNQIKEISDTLPNKADVDDLSELRDFLTNKFEELINESTKKFSDKNDTIKYLKYLEEQIKNLYSTSRIKGDIHMPENNWLLATKPITGFSCAACESYIGDLKSEKEKFIPWNKLPTRENGEKLYRMGNGFSKMLSMLNFDSYGNVYLNPNAESNNNSDEDDIKTEIKRNKEKNLSGTLLIRTKSQRDGIALSNDHKITINKIGKRTQNNFFKKEDVKTTLLPKIKKELTGEIYEVRKESEENPKITRVFKKSHSKLNLKENN